MSVPFPSVFVPNFSVFCVNHSVLVVWGERTEMTGETQPLGGAAMGERWQNDRVSKHHHYGQQPFVRFPFVLFCLGLIVEMGRFLWVGIPIYLFPVRPGDTSILLKNHKRTCLLNGSLSPNCTVLKRNWLYDGYVWFYKNREDIKTGSHLRIENMIIHPHRTKYVASQNRWQD